MKLPFKKIFKWSAIILVLVFCVRVCSCDPSNITAAPAIYRSAEDFYKLTLVEFPELVLKDSVYYDDGSKLNNLIIVNLNNESELKRIIKLLDANRIKGCIFGQSTLILSS